MFTSAACRFALFFLISLSANADKGGLRVLDQSESAVDTSKALAVVGADDAHRMLNPTHLVGVTNIGTPTTITTDTIGLHGLHTDIFDADFGGKFLPPGTYHAAAAMGLTGILTLVGAVDSCSPTVKAENGFCPSQAEDRWEIYIGGAFTTAASSMMKFDAGSGSPANVYWKVLGGAITMGARSTAFGSMETPGAMTMGTGTPFTFDYDATFIIGGALNMPALSTMVLVGIHTVAWTVTGAITLGTGATAVGDMTSTAGAITLGAGASSGNLDAAGAITLGAGDSVVAGNLRAGVAITVGASAHTGTLQAVGAITKGAAADTGATLDYTTGTICLADCGITACKLDAWTCSCAITGERPLAPFAPWCCTILGTPLLPEGCPA
jgi:hypothetical protein